MKMERSSFQENGQMTTMNDKVPLIYDVWQFEFVYEDQPNKFKKRPIIIGAIDEDYVLALIVKVTSHEPREDYPGEVTIEDWKEAGLEKKSTARCSKTMLVPVEAFSKFKYYGHLSERDSEKVASMLINLGYIS